MSQDDSSSSDEEDESALTANIEDYAPGKYVLYRHTQRKVYVASIFEVAEKVTLKAVRKYGERNGRVTFCWPQIYLYIYVDQLQNEKLTALPDPVVDRRGSSVIFKRGVFGKLSLGDLE